MNYFKIGFPALIFVFSATLSFAQSEEMPTLYGDKGGPVPELISEETMPPVPEVIDLEEMEPAPEPVANPVPEPVNEGKGDSDMWFWAIAILLIAGGALWLGKRNKTDSSTN